MLSSHASRTQGGCDKKYTICLNSLNHPTVQSAPCGLFIVFWDYDSYENLLRNCCLKIHVIGIFKRGFWLAGCTTASQSEAMWEYPCCLTWISTCIFIVIQVPVLSILFYKYRVWQMSMKRSIPLWTPQNALICHQISPITHLPSSCATGSMHCHDNFRLYWQWREIGENRF